MDELYQLFLAVAGGQGGSTSAPGYGLADLIASIGATPPSAPAVTTTSKAKTTSTSGGGGDSPLITVLKNGLGVAPLIGGLISLFGGGGDDTPPPLVKYAMPAAVDFDAATTADGGFATASYDQGGFARPTPPVSAATGPAAVAPAQSSAATPQITVNVQAMDARSFMDRSTDIAAAVREAMLNLNSINDVVNDL